MNVADYKPFDRRLGAVDPGVMQAAIPELAPVSPSMPLASYFWLAVSAGLTVWFVTRALDRALSRR